MRPGIGRDGQAERIELSPEVVALLNPGPAWQAGLMLTRGELAEATRCANERGLGVTDEPSYPREGEYLVLTPVLLAEQEPSQASGSLSGCTPRR